MCLTAKYDSDGNYMWHAEVGEMWIDACAVDEEGGIYLVSATLGSQGSVQSRLVIE